MKTNYKTRGFTLIELLVVIAIIGLLSAVILASLNTARNKGYDATRQSNLREVQSALDEYYQDNGKYPPANGSYYTDSNSDGEYAIAGQCSNAYGPMAANSVITGLTPNYIAQLPTDPQTVPASNICCYEYLVSQSGANYKFMFWDCSSSAAGNATGAAAGLDDPPGSFHHTAAWSVYSGTGTLF